ncbi:hypothetical protein ACJRO7_018011 [Eucalyptus globulus]|uniref:Uncharacterized protein n=1 Tax=Eucalyptus globulus TaxID=34317 RepID=A0ABD3KYG7_EUCGL
MNDSPVSSCAQSSPWPESSNQVNQAPMKKTLFYNFLPSKAVEDAERARNIPHRVTWQLIEIRDEHPLPRSKSHDHPTLIKVVDEEDVFTRKLHILHHAAFDYMFRHWFMSDVENILTGHKHYVMVRDDTGCDDGGSSSSGRNRVNEPLWYNGPSVFVKKCDHCDEYYLNCRDLYRSRRIGIGDSIELQWDVTYRYLHLKVVHKSK